MAKLVTSRRETEGAGFVVARPFPVLLLGGLPIRAPIVHYGPFVRNARAEIRQAIEDYQAGRVGAIPADQLAPRGFA